MAAVGLSEILKDLYGYNELQAVNFFRLLIARDVFQEFSYSKYIIVKSVAMRRRRQWCDELASIKAHSNFHKIKFTPEGFPTFEKALELMNSLTFDTKLHALKWLRAVTQLRFLRNSFHKESLAAQEAGDLKINIARWDLEDEASTDQNFMKVLKSLNLLEQLKWPEQTPAHVAIHGCMEKYVKESLSVLAPPNPGESYVVSYLTNPRGLFNNEASLPIILANWFGDDKLASKISSALKTATETMDWREDLIGLKLHILTSIGRDTWPTGKGWYYHNDDSKIYDAAATRERRQSLKDWPTAMDMIDYYFKLHIAKYPQGSFANVKLTSCLANLPKIVNTSDTVKIWVEQFGKKFIGSDSQVAFIFYSHPVARMYQDILTKHILAENRLSFTSVTAEDKHLSFKLIADCIAKGIYRLAGDCGMLAEYKSEVEPAPRHRARPALF